MTHMSGVIFPPSSILFHMFSFVYNVVCSKPMSLSTLPVTIIDRFCLLPYLCPLT